MQKIFQFFFCAANANFKQIFENDHPKYFGESEYEQNLRIKVK